MVKDWPHPSGLVDFPGRNAGEQMQFYFRHHGVRLFSAFLRSLFFSVILGVIGYVVFPANPADRGSTWHAVLLSLLICLFILQMEFLLRFYQHFIRLIIVTDQSVHRIRKTLLAFDSHEVIDLASLQDVSKSQRGLVQNILGFGTLVLEAQNTIIRIHFTPHVARTHQWLMELRDQARRRSMNQNHFDRSPYRNGDSSR